ncbi:MAG TPA: molybdopterin-synthase adenylyltransferase MoeB [Rhodothermales bacterium]
MQAIDTMASVELSNEEIRRYSRHLILPEVGMEGQKKLKAASVLLVGAGGLGSPLALYLAAAGVGRIGIVDFDVVDETNLHRQVIHGTSDVGRKKLESARDRIREINPFVKVELHDVQLTSENALEILKGYDVVADGTDNFPTRYLVNDACVMLGIPNVYASIFRFEGQASVFGAPGGPCYRCVYAEPPPPGLVPSCAEGGVLGVLPGMVGTIQATEVIKMICGIGEPLIGKLLLIDTLSMQFRTLKLRRDPNCPVCGDHPTQTELIDYHEFCGIPSTNGDMNHNEAGVPEMTVAELKRRMDAGTTPFLLDVRDPHEFDIANLGVDAPLIPVRQLPARLDELEGLEDEEIVIYCRSGNRSATAVRILQQAGFKKPVNLRGGVLAWSEEIDPTVPQY